MRHRGMVALALLMSAMVSAQAGEMKKTTVRASIGADGVQRVAVVAGDYYFSPNHIIVKAKVPVELSVRKESGMVPHDLVVQAPEAGMNIKEKLSAEPKNIRFTPTRPGSYPFYCGKKLPFAKSHREKGMEGVLEVVE